MVALAAVARARACLALLSALAVTAMMASPTAASAAATPDDGYIVGLRGGANPAAAASAHADRFDIHPEEIYRSALDGYSAEISPQAVEGLRDDPGVRFVERDRKLSIEGTPSRQALPPWGLDRIDQHQLPLLGSFSYASTGRGVTAYILDSGIRASHSEFGGRAVSEQDFVDRAHPAGPRFNNGRDCNGHGTHVAGTVGGRTYGVAKQVSLVGVRVLDCDGWGYTSEVIDGIDWVTAHHRAGQPAVANMSVTGFRSVALDAAVSSSIRDGISYVVAAGNGNAQGSVDACSTSPGRVGAAMTVSATDTTDERPSWANYGSCVDWFAPGVGIQSAGLSDDSATALMSGTSMATPHTTGAAALYLQRRPNASPAAVQTALSGATTKRVVSSSKTRRNDLLFTAP